MRDFALEKVNTIIQPGPVLLLVTSDGGRDNVMTVAWHSMLEFSPPVIGFCVAPENYSLKALLKTRECVIAVPGVDLIDKAIGVGTCSGASVDKFERFSLHREQPSCVKAPLVRECLYNIECRLADTALGKKYDFFAFEAVKAWENPDRREKRFFHALGDGMFSVQGRVLDRRKLMKRG